jgi:hypothetical protein
VATINQLDRATTKLLVYVAEAINLPAQRMRRVTASFGCAVKLHALLRALVLDAAIDPGDDKRGRAALSAFTAALNAFAHSASETARRHRGAKPKSVPAVRIAMPAEIRDPEVALDSSEQLRSGEASERSESQPQEENGDPGGPGALDLLRGT